MSKIQYSNDPTGLYDYWKQDKGGDPLKEKSLEDMANFTLCAGPTKFYVNTDGLTDGSGMFKSISVLTSFSGGLPNLTNGYYMFSGCSSLTSWTVDLPNLTDGSYMFSGCSGLTSFTGALPNLTNGSNMFSGCTLDKDSVHRIAESIPSKPDDATSGYSLTLGIDYSLHEDADVAADLATITTTKKWSLTTQWN